MKKTYENPIIEIVEFDLNDVITTSNQFGNTLLGLEEDNEELA